MQNITEKYIEEFIEKGADLEHDRWARWQAYMFSKASKNEDGSITIPKELVDRWFRQIDTKYSELSESEKESDRKETRNYLPLLEHALTAHAKEVLEKVRPQKEVNLSSADSDIYNEGVADGYFACLNQLKSNARDLGINLE